jgi:hypothetical protein
MLLENYKNSGLLFNLNFLEQSDTAGLFGYRGELVIVEGEVADAKGHHKPPVEVLRGAVILADEKIKLLVGALDNIAFIKDLLEKYQADFAPDMKALIYAVNLKDSVQVDIGGINFVMIALGQGVPWNEVIDEMALEKSDFKGQSAAEKIVTLYNEMQSYKPKYPTASLDEVLSSATDAVREGWGAV